MRSRRDEWSFTVSVAVWGEHRVREKGVKLWSMAIRLMWKYLMGVFIWRGSWQWACPWLLSFALLLSKHFSAWKRIPEVSVFRFVWVHPSIHECVCVCLWVDVDVYAPILHRVITYNHPKCLYCTNSITMLTEWLCGMGIAGVVNGARPLRDYPGSDCHAARQTAC